MSTDKRPFKSEAGEKVVVFSIPAAKCSVVEVTAMFAAGDIGGTHVQTFTVCGDKVHAGQNLGFANGIGAGIECKNGAIIACSKRQPATWLVSWTILKI